MHDCPACGVACDCDGEDHWRSVAFEECEHYCWEDDICEDDIYGDEWLAGWAEYPGDLLVGEVEDAPAAA